MNKSFNFNRFKKNSIIILGKFLGRCTLYNIENGFSYTIRDDEFEYVCGEVIIFRSFKILYLPDELMEEIYEEMNKHWAKNHQNRNYQYFEYYQISDFLILPPLNKKLCKRLYLGLFLNRNK